MSKRTYQIGERVIIAAMTIGLIGMFQPFQIDLYSWGFHILLIGTLSFIVFTKFDPGEEQSGT
ncbi:MAG: hypothetical protein HXY40_11670 [Chloroflexi bacterium]|nr:hypothetical protein [Chloroflexota bacterium]